MVIGFDGRQYCWKMAGSDQHVNGGGNIMVWDVFLLLVLVILHVFMGP